MRAKFSASILAAILLVPVAAIGAHHATVHDVVAPLVTLNPAPGVSIGIPRDWIACEDDAEKQLTSAEDTFNAREKFCSEGESSSFKLKAFDPRPYHGLAVIFKYHSDQLLSEKALAALTPDVLDAISPKLCETEFKPLSATGAVESKCDVEIGAFAGQRALVSTLVYSTPGHSDLKAVIVSYELPYSQGYLQVQFSYPELLATVVKPSLDTIIGSVRIENSAPGRPAPDGGMEQETPSHGTPAPSAPETPVPSGSTI